MTKVFNKNFHYTIETIMISFRPTSFTYLVNKRCGYQPRYRVQFILKHLKTLYINCIMRGESISPVYGGGEVRPWQPHLCWFILGEIYWFLSPIVPSLIELFLFFCIALMGTFQKNIFNFFPPFDQHHRPMISPTEGG